MPWYLTWFGHSLNSYRDVVRLYDYFLASPFLMPLYVTVAIVLYREEEIFKEDCDMASLHCLLSQVCYFVVSNLSEFYSLKKTKQNKKNNSPIASRRFTIRISAAKG